MTFEQRPVGGEEVSLVDIWGKGIQEQREQQVQRPWGWWELSMFEKNMAGAE